MKERKSVGWALPTNKYAAKGMSVGLFITLAALIVSLPRFIFAAGTPVGTIIPNVAKVTYIANTDSFETMSNVSTVEVVELINVNVVKTAAVGGTAGAVSGATIVYTLTVTVSGSGNANGLVITDPIPVNTAYTAGTLKLDAVTLTDGLDADAGDVGATTPGVVTVNLGDVPGGSSTKAITFEVKIN